MKPIRLLACSWIALAAFSTAKGQSAGAGADSNKADRKETEKQVIINSDLKPLQDDVVGNAIVGGTVTGAITGSIHAGMISVGLRVVGGELLQRVKPTIQDSLSPAFSSPNADSDQ